MADEWGPWIEHDGQGCPVPIGTILEAKFQCGCARQYLIDQNHFSPLELFWFCMPQGLRCSICKALLTEGLPVVSRYRIRKPRGMEILEQLVADPPRQPVREDA